MEEESAKTCDAAGAIKTEGSLTKVAVVADPPFILKMFARKLHRAFIVGDPLSGPPEEIKVNEDLLMAHSETFQLMLEESALAEKGPVNVPDIQPDTFRNLLRFVYGYNNLSALSMEEAVDLMYVAEKYMVEELKPKLSAHICSILTVDNVCIPLQRPECFQQESLKNAITETIQKFTHLLLCQQDFLHLNTFGLVNILQQDTLAVPEIELWKAVLRWANPNAKTKEAGTNIRELLTKPLKYIRLCSLTLEDFGKEVCLTKILTDQEVSLIIESISSNTLIEDLTTVCNKVQTRDLSVSLMEVNINIANISNYDYVTESHLFILTKHVPIVMMAAFCESYTHSFRCAPQGLQFPCECKVSVTRITEYSSNTSTESPVEFVFKKDVYYGTDFAIPLMIDGKYVKLLSNNKYRFTFTFNKNIHLMVCYYSPLKNNTIDHNFVTIELGPYENEPIKYSGSHITKFTFELYGTN